MVDFNKLKELASKSNTANFKLAGDGNYEKDYTLTVPYSGASNRVNFVIVPPVIGEGEDAIRLYDDEDGVLFPYFTINVKNRFGGSKFLRTLGDDPVRKWAWNKLKSESDLEADKRTIQIGTNYLLLVYVVEDEHRPENNGTFQVLSVSRKTGQSLIEELESDYLDHMPIGFVNVGVVSLAYVVENKKKWGQYKIKILDKPHDILSEVKDVDAFTTSMEEMAEKYRRVREWGPDMDAYVKDFISFIGQDEWLKFGGDEKYVTASASKEATPPPSSSLAEELDDNVPWLDEKKPEKVADIEPAQDVKIPDAGDVDIDDIFND